MAVRVLISCVPSNLKVNAGAMRRAARAVLKGEGVANAELSLAFVDDATSARTNWQFLRHRGPTDVITFPLSESAAESLMGELVIGGEVGAREARRRGHAVVDELALYVIHGILHLCGYDDKSAAKRKAMRARELHYLNRLKIGAINAE